jgi:hypothetical protein
MHTLPGVSQFQVVANRKEISKDDQWPDGHIEAVPVKFPVDWVIESPQSADGVFKVRQPDMTPLLTAHAACDLLRNDVANLSENPVIHYRGFLKPGQTIAVDILRENVRASVTFEVIGKGTITFIHEVFQNMVTWHEIWEHYSEFDKRICPWECYINEELRPYFSDTPLRFRLKDAHNMPDTTHEFGGVAGGQTPRGEVLPPIVFPKAPIDTTSPKDPKVAGSATGPIGSQTGSDSSSDSWEEEDIADVDMDEAERFQWMAIADAHKLRKLRQAVVKGLGITIEIRGSYTFEGQEHEVVFSKEVKVSVPPSHLIEPYQLAFKQIEQIGLM